MCTMAFQHLGTNELVTSKDIGESFFDKVFDNTPDIVSPRSVRLSRELVIWQHIPQHFGERCDRVWLDNRSEVLHGDDPLWQELHQDASARTLLLFVWHGAVLNEPRVEKDIARIPCDLYVVVEEITDIERSGFKLRSRPDCCPHVLCFDTSA